MSQDIDRLQEEAKDDRADRKLGDDNLWIVVHAQGKEIVEIRTHQAVMDERVATLVKFVDRLVTAVYAAAGSIFLAAVSALVFQRGFGA